MDDFLLRALLAGVGLALVAGPLGCVMVWRRMAYFGDTLSHAALLGIALGLLTGIGVNPGVVLVCLAVAGLLTVWQDRQQLAGDTLLGILSHSALAFGMLALAALDNGPVDLMAYLFGDILAVTPADLAWLWGGGALVLLATGLLWRSLLAITVDEDLATVEGVPVRRTRLCFMLLMAATVALAMKLVGILLVTALLVIPAATARRLAATPESMALIASITGMLAVSAGLGLSMLADWPGGPAIVASASLLFVLSRLLQSR
jgi:zinc transport system permease protein